MPAPLPETPAAPPPPLPETNHLPRWQYRVIKNPDFAIFRDLGNEGWELVSVTNTLLGVHPCGPVVFAPADSFTTAYFKRQIVD